MPFGPYYVLVSVRLNTSFHVFMFTDQNMFCIMAVHCSLCAFMRKHEQSPRIAIYTCLKICVRH